MFGISRTARLVALLASLAACGDDGRPTCDELAEKCHDSTSDLGKECHELGHDGDATEEQCEERKDECLAECT